MGSGRKRPADRSETPTGERKREGKPKKKKSKLKHKESTSDSTSHKPSLETTATAEGQIMAQVLSTFSRLEQSRFEAFRRATFAGDAISKYVAQLLIQRKSPSEVGRRAPVLDEVCAPGQAEEITIVVTTLAKAYAQRLVTAARRRMLESNNTHNNDIDNNNTTSNSNQQQQQQQQPIEAHYILEAHREREAQGLDPGFFLQPWSASNNLSLDQQSTKKYNQLRLAALKAQEDFDKEHGAPGEEGDKDSDDGSEDLDFMDESPSKQTPVNNTMEISPDKKM